MRGRAQALTGDGDRVACRMARHIDEVPSGLGALALAPPIRHPEELSTDQGSGRSQGEHRQADGDPFRADLGHDVAGALAPPSVDQPGHRGGMLVAPLSPSANTARIASDAGESVATTDAPAGRRK